MALAVMSPTKAGYSPRRTCDYEWELPLGLDQGLGFTGCGVRLVWGRLARANGRNQPCQRAGTGRGAPVSRGCR